MYSGYEITFDSAGCWSFDNNITRNVIIFCVNNSSLSHSNNCKDHFSILGEGLVSISMEALVHEKKRLVLILLKQTQKFA